MKIKTFNLQSWLLVVIVGAAWWVTASITGPFLHYHSQQTGFLATFSFFSSYAVQPGGIADYVAEFIAQFFYFNGPGSFLIVLIAAIQGMVALDIVTRLKGKNLWGFTVVGLLVLFGILVMSDYRYPYYASVRLLFALIFTWLFCFVHNRQPKVSLLAWPFMAFLLLYLAGGPAMFVFTLSSALILAITRTPGKWFFILPLMLGFAALLPWLSYQFLFRTSLSDLYKIIQVRHPELLAYSTFYQLYLYYSLLPLFLLVGLFFRTKKGQESHTVRRKGQALQKTAFYKKAPVIYAVQLICLVLLAGFLFKKSHDPVKKKQLYIEYLADEGKWQKLLEESQQIRTYDFRVNFHINRAYAHLGQLPENLFNYPQLLGVNALLYDNSTINGSLTMPNSDLYFDLGLMSESQRWAFEAQTLMPGSPRILKRLVMINLVNRKYQLAESFLNVLGQNPIQRKWVEKYRSYVADTTLAEKDPLIAEKRRFSPNRYFIHKGSLENLKFLVETNPENRFAFDYLMSYCILATDYPDFLHYLPMHESFNRGKLPRSWEEALAVYILRHKSFPHPVTPETVSKEVVQRFAEFNKILEKYNNNLPAAQNDLRRNFENTCWYYLLYLDPKVTRVLDKKTVIK